MSYCEKCGTKLNEDMAFCPSCGNKKNAEKEEIVNQQFKSFVVDVKRNTEKKQADANAYGTYKKVLLIAVIVIGVGLGYIGTAVIRFAEEVENYPRQFKWSMKSFENWLYMYEPHYIQTINTGKTICIIGLIAFTAVIILKKEIIKIFSK